VELPHGAGTSTGNCVCGSLVGTDDLTRDTYRPPPRARRSRAFHGSTVHELGGEAEVPEPDRVAAATVEEKIVRLDVVVRDPAAVLESSRLVLDN
jgi:hypothetical protein